MPAQLNAFLAQHPPNRGVRDAERSGQGTAIPPGQPGWRRQLQLPQNAQPHLGTVFWFLAWPRLITQPVYTPGRKPLAPQTDRVWPYLQARATPRRSAYHPDKPERSWHAPPGEPLRSGCEQGSSVQLVVRQNTPTPPRPGSPDTSTGMKT